jgi:hypothetical protein
MQSRSSCTKRGDRTDLREWIVRHCRPLAICQRVMTLVVTA